MSTLSILGPLMMIVLLAPASAALAERPGTAGAPAADPGGMLGTTDGEQVYKQICQGCHMSEGRGAVGAGYYPAFAGNPNLRSANYMAATILLGRRNMPSFEKPATHEFFFPATWLTDTQIANVVNYIRTHFGNHHADPISAADVAALRTRETGQ